MNVINRTTKLRWRRNFKRKQRIIEGIGSGAEEHIDRHFFRRLGRLYEVRRFLLGWLLLIILASGLTIAQTRALGNYYQTIKPTPGGIYSEGIVGSFTNANPIFAAGEVDSAVARLMFLGLMTYDSKGQLVGDLAKSLAVDATGKVYTVVLNSDLYWQDNKPITAQDVVYTLQSIQNPDVKSPLFSAWQGIKVTALDIKTITFTLPNILASFPHSLTVGILPKHILGNVAPGSLRSSLFNTTQPIGSGPFKWHGVSVVGDTVKNRQQSVTLLASPNYFKGRPKLNQFVIRSFLDEGQMLKSFKAGELNAMAGVQDLPDDLKTDLNVSQYNVPLAGEVLAFFNTSSKLLGDMQVRRALEMAVDQRKVMASLSYPSVSAKSPLLRDMPSYDPAITQKPFDLQSANNTLETAGWVRGKDGLRSKSGQILRLTLNTLNTVEYASVANVLQDQWKQLGIDITVTSLNQADLQGAIDSRSYDILVYGISLGGDPDQFAYWHSSQADVRASRRLNFSNYSSKVADASLEAGRTRTDPSLRAAKYRPFLEAWRDDAPAMALYQPRMLYVSQGAVFNFDVKKINSAADRYYGVQNWMIRTEHVTNE